LFERQQKKREKNNSRILNQQTPGQSRVFSTNLQRLVELPPPSSNPAQNKSKSLTPAIHCSNPHGHQLIGEMLENVAPGTKGMNGSKIIKASKTKRKAIGSEMPPSRLMNPDGRFQANKQISTP
jgi:hypothetical protein